MEEKVIGSPGRAWAWIVLAATGFGVGFPLTKWLFSEGVDVWQVFVPRYVVATVIVVAVVAVRRRPRDPAFKRGGVLAVVNVVGPTIALTVATDLLPASVVGVLTALIPAATVAAANWIVPGERFTARHLPGLVVAAVGVGVLVVGGSDVSGAALSVAGVVIAVVGIFFAGAGGALNRRFASTDGAASLAIPQFMISTLLVIVITAPLGGLDLADLPLRIWIGLLALGAVSTALPFAGLLIAAESASAATVSIVGYLVPIVGAGSSIVALGEPVTRPFVVGGALVAVGVWLTARVERGIAAHLGPVGSVEHRRS